MKRWRWVAVLAGAITSLAVGVSPALASDTLLGGQTLSPGQALTSANGRYELTMQGDGNLVLLLRNRSSERSLWSSGTGGDSGARAVLQGNGNLVIYDGADTALWSANTSGAGCTNLVVQNDGNLVLYRAAGAVWSSHTLTSILQPSDDLVAGEAVYSPNEQYQLLMQNDGNLVAYGPSGAVFNTVTQGHPGAYAVMQSDGNVVVYGAGGALWNSGTAGHAGSTAAMQSDGNVVVYNAGTALWNAGSEANRPAGTPQFSPPAFAACPPPPSPPPPPPAATPPPAQPVVLVPVKSPTPRLRVKVVVYWTWDHAITHLRRIRIPHVPRHASVTVICRGRGCRRHIVHSGRAHVGTLLRGLSRRTYHAGDRLLIVITEPGHRAESIAVRIRNGRVPRLRLL